VSEFKECKMTEDGLIRAIKHLGEYEKISADELMQILGVVTNDRKFAGLMLSLWRMLIDEVRQRLLDDVTNLEEETWQ